MKKLLLIAAFTGLLHLWGCATSATEIEPGLQPREYFQKAQEASDADKYKLALAYYEAFLEAFPEERDRVLWAQYEIALLHEKMGNLELSLKLLSELLARYDSPEAADYPPGPRVLAAKVKARVETALAK